MLDVVRKMIVALCLLNVAASSTLCLAEGSAYTIERDPYAPVKRLSEDKTSGTKKTFIRDPDIEGKRTKLPKVAGQKPKSRLVYKEVSHEFKPAKIKGTLRAPRVTFTQDPLELTRIADPMPTDFLDQALDSNGATNY